MNKQITIKSDGENKRIDYYLAENFSDYSRSRWKQFINNGSVLVNSKIVNGSFHLSNGDKITIIIKLSKKTKQDVEVIYKDKDVLVLNKPAGMLTHAKDNADSEYTIADVVDNYYKGESKSSRNGIVHRLDRTTSGVIVTALNIATENKLKQQFAERKVKKVYIAVVEGRVKESSFKVDMPITRSVSDARKFKTHPDGKQSVTDFKLIKRADEYSVLIAKPLSGRTHQIRVHLAAINHPIVGDKLYGAQDSKTRVLLHAYMVTIRINDKYKTFTAIIPSDMKNRITKKELDAATS